MSDTPPRAVLTWIFERMESERRESIGELFAGDAVVTAPGARFQGAKANQERVHRTFAPADRSSSLEGD